MCRKTFSLLTVLVLANSLFAQDTITIVAQKIIKHGSVEHMNQIKKEREDFIKNYVDSLNNNQDSIKDVLPSFFTTVDFDKKYGSQFNLSVNGKVSIRKLIIDQLTNENLLWKVRRSSNAQIKSKFENKPPGTSNYYTPIPFQQYSTQELVIMRLDEIENKRNLGIIDN